MTRCMRHGMWFLLIFAGCIGVVSAQEDSLVVDLPAPEVKGAMSVEQALLQRRSVREFSVGPLELADIAQILWAAQGRTSAEGRRTTPSAGALMPLEIYLVAGKVKGLVPGVYHYLVESHMLRLIRTGDLRESIAAAAHAQTWIADAPVHLFIAADFQRMRGRYGSRAERYGYLEAGHAAQNVYLQCAARGLVTVFVGAFDDRKLQDLFALPAGQIPLGLMPFGRRP